jgi:hypothetical protein
MQGKPSRISFPRPGRFAQAGDRQVAAGDKILAEGQGFQRCFDGVSLVLHSAASETGFRLE